LNNEGDPDRLLLARVVGWIFYTRFFLEEQMDSATRDAILLFVQTASLIALIVYVIKTWEMASASRQSAEISKNTLLEMKEARNQEIAPYIVVYFDKTAMDPEFYLVIKNTGKSMAHDVRLEFDPPLYIHQDLQHFLNRFLPPNIIPTMAPDYEIRTGLGIFKQYCEGNNPEFYSVKVNYYGGINSTPQSISYRLDLSHFHGLVGIVDNKPNEISDALRKINDSCRLVISEIQELRKANRGIPRKKTHRNI
jgi:hypothetical protein